jgi:ADP-heptose:LPS heptosyltransferase
LNRKVFNLYAGGLFRNPRVASGTIVHRARVGASRKFSRKPVILFERHSGIGDIICTFPSVLELRKRHPDAVFVYSTRQSFKSIAEMGRVADVVVESDWSPEMPKVMHQDYDQCYQPQLEDEQPLGREHAHLVDDFSQTLGVKPSSRQPKLHVPAALSQLLVKKLKPFSEKANHVVGIHIGPSWRVREWTAEGWTKLVTLLRDSFDCVVMQLGSDMDTAKGFVKAPRIAGAEDWVGKLNLEESVAALEQLDLFIGIDSGLLHAAGAVGTPTVGLFGPINPKLRLPPETPSLAVVADVPCLGCHHRLPRLHWQDGCPNNIQCMAGLTAENVVEACGSLLRVPQLVS